MNNKTKKIVSIGTMFLAAGILASCNSFCDEFDYSSYRYGYDPLNTLLFDSREDALEYLNLQLADETVNYPLFTLDTKIKSKTGEDINLISDTKFGGYELYYIHPITLTLTSSELDSNGNNYTKILNLSKNNFTVALEEAATTKEISKPFNQYYEEFDLKVLDNIFNEMLSKTNIDLAKAALSYKDIYGYSFEDYKTYIQNQDNEELLRKMLNGSEGEYKGRNNSLLTLYGYSKYTPVDGNSYSFIETINSEIINVNSNIRGYGMTSDYLSLYKSTMDAKFTSLKTCISIADNGLYGHISNDKLNETVLISNKAEDGFLSGWGEAFSKHGLLEGLLVYPIAYSVESLSAAFGLNGWGQIWAVLLVTIIIRTVFSAITLPSTLSTQKMNFIQPEITKLQQKYPNANTNQYEKQRLAQAQMALYKKHNIHPFRSILVLFLQFPLFISVWNAMTGCASLSSDSVMGLYLSDTIWNTLSNLTNWPTNPGWWTALVLILLMSVSQVVAMLIPQWLNKKRNASVAKTVVSESQKQTQNSTKTMSYVMTAMVIVMGFTLPSAMGVYWFAGAIFSIAQTLITQLIILKDRKVK